MFVLQVVIPLLFLLYTLATSSVISLSVRQTKKGCVRVQNDLYVVKPKVEGGCLMDGCIYPGLFSNIKGSVRARAINKKKISSAGWVSVSSYGSFLGVPFCVPGRRW